MNAESAARDLYDRYIDGWNAGDAKSIAATISADGLVIGFDGSQMVGSEAVATELEAIFADHDPAKYVTEVRSVRELGPGVALLHAVAGMTPPGGGELIAERNAIQAILVEADEDGGWSIALLQNTPAEFDGRPELAEALTDELNDALSE